MPIRTQRGRAAVYRQVWGWPLRSMWHLAAAIAVIIGVGVGIGVLTPDGHTRSTTGQPHDTSTSPTRSTTDDRSATRDREAASASPLSSPTSSSSPAPGGGARDGGITDTATPAPDGTVGAVAVAEAWTRAWVNHPDGVDVQQWAAPMRPWTAPEAYAQLLTTDPRTVPASAVTGAPVVVPGSSATTADVDVPTDVLLLRVTVVYGPDGWQIVAWAEAP